MRIWRMSFWRTKSTIRSWAGSFVHPYFLFHIYLSSTWYKRGTEFFDWVTSTSTQEIFPHWYRAQVSKHPNINSNINFFSHKIHSVLQPFMVISAERILDNINFRVSFQHFGNWGGVHWTGKISVSSRNLGKIEDYEKWNTFLQTCINLAKLQLCNFEKHSDLILGLHIQKIFIFQNFWSEFSITVCKNFQIGNLLSSTRNKRYFSALGIGPEFWPQIGSKRNTELVWEKIQTTQSSLLKP